MRSRWIILVLVVPALLLAAGCTTAKSKAMQAKLIQMSRNPQVEPDYIIDPPDVLSIEVKGYPEYSRQVTVRPDGKITVTSVGDLAVQGLTTIEAAEAIQEVLLQELSQPSVTVMLVAARSKAVYLWGEVRSQGRKEYFGDMTLMDALGLAGGTTRYADAGKVTLTRVSLDNPKVINISLRRLIYDGAGEHNVVLHEGDIIYVPPTGFAKVGYAVDQLLFPFRSALSGVVTSAAIDDAFNDDD